MSLDCNSICSIEPRIGGVSMKEISMGLVTPLIQFCRVILSRMVEPYRCQSFLDEYYCLLSSTFVSSRRL